MKVRASGSMLNDFMNSFVVEIALLEHLDPSAMGHAAIVSMGHVTQKTDDVSAAVDGREKHVT